MYCETAICLWQLVALWKICPDCYLHQRFQYDVMYEGDNHFSNSLNKRVITIDLIRISRYSGRIENSCKSLAYTLSNT